MEAKDRVLPNWKLIDVAETLYNFRGAMDIEGIKNTLWQLTKQQDNVSFKAGIKKVVDWIKTERKCKYINDITYYPIYEKALEAQLKGWGIKEDK